MRALLRKLFAQTIVALVPAERMKARALAARHHVRNGGSLLVVAFGKAARPMATAMIDGIPTSRVRGLLVTPEPDAAPLPPFEVIPGGHPLPTAGSVRAAARALELCSAVTPEDYVVFLVSGGGSAMLELPADPEVTLDALRELYAALVGCGADIASMNLIRRHLSSVKGGRLALAAAKAHMQDTIVLVDVPGPLSDVASGPTLPDPTTLAHCLAAIDRWKLWPSIPQRLKDRLRSGDLPPALSPSDRTQTMRALKWMDNTDARRHMKWRACFAGLHVVNGQCIDDLPYEGAAEALVRSLDRVRRRYGGRVGLLTGGELPVTLPANPGTGGRNQQFVLACARLIRGRPITVLSAGTDGIDGNSPAAGAVADGTTMARARALGRDVHDALRRCDAFPLLDALGDTIVTGPTGTNVRDLRLLVHG